MGGGWFGCGGGGGGGDLGGERGGESGDGMQRVGPGCPRRRPRWRGRGAGGLPGTAPRPPRPHTGGADGRTVETPGGQAEALERALRVRGGARGARAAD